jgi:sulfite exporter TauE/SafE
MPELSLVSAFLAGLLGGVHCVGMCGGLVTAFAFGIPGGRSGLAFQLACNVGRVATYVALGALAGVVGAGTLLFEHAVPVQRILFAASSLMLLGLGLYLAGLFARFSAVERIGQGLWRRVQPLLGRVLPIRSVGGALAAGVLWGFLPCGLVYSAVVLAIASASASQGALTMAAFGAGTLPNLLAMGMMAGRLQPHLQDRRVRVIAGALVAAFGLWGLAKLA